MGRSGLSSHRKFKRLVKELGSPITARGVLELIWDGCYECGDDRLGDEVDVAAICSWKKASKTLVDALVRSGFVEERNPGEFFVHDLWDHAPAYVEKRKQRELARIARGQTISSVRSEAGKRGRSSQLAQQAGSNGGQPSTPCPTESDTRGTNGSTPPPSPPPSTPLPPYAPDGIEASGQTLGGFNAAVKAVVNPLLEEWPTEDPIDARPTNPSIPKFALAVHRILEAYGDVTPEILLEAGRSYIREKVNRFSAPQAFFGPGREGKDPTWLGYAKTAIHLKVENNAS